MQCFFDQLIGDMRPIEVAGVGYPLTNVAKVTDLVSQGRKFVREPRNVQRGETMIRNRASQKRVQAILLLLALMASVIVPQRSMGDAGKQPTVIHQLRIYEIFDSNKKAFHDRFRDHAIRIMAKYDFKIVATWEAKTKQSNRIHLPA
jgi:hypothetical protein